MRAIGKSGNFGSVEWWISLRLGCGGCLILDADLVCPKLWENLGLGMVGCLVDCAEWNIASNAILCDLPSVKLSVFRWLSGSSAARLF